MTPCVIFDLDGTLVDSLPGIANSLNRTLHAHGLLGHSTAAVRSLIGDGLRHLMEHAAPAGSDPTLIESLLRLYKKDYELTWAQSSQVYPGVAAMLTKLQAAQCQLAVLSNKIHPFTVAMTESVFPEINFAKILGQRDGIPHKPNPAGALEIATALNSNPENCWFVGDSTIDILTALNAGMTPVAVTWGYHDPDRLLDAGAKILIDHPDQLPPLITAARSA